MKTTIAFIAFVLGISFYTQAQSKKELLAEVERLKGEVSETKAALAESKKNERVATTKIETMESQMASLKEANNSILSKMGSFTELSQKKADNLEKSLQAIKKKDEQLSTINELLTKADSTKLATFSLLKNALSSVGDKEAKLRFDKNAVVVDISNDFLFKSTKTAEIQDNAKTLVLSKIAAVLKSRQNLNFQVEGNSNEASFDNNLKDNWDLSSLQSAAIVRAFQTDFEIEPKRMLVVGKSQYSTDVVETISTIKILPKYDVFYEKIKESMKD